MLVQFLDTIRKRFKRPLQLLLSSAMLWLCVFAQAQAAENQQSERGAVVGKVSLLLGKARLETGDSAKIPVTVGTEIRVHDRIVTDLNGHVHIHFIDKALVSVRPDSRLEITNYHYVKERPEESSVKFSLQEGITRSISGDAAHSARQRFRLNTPIAAIGVRGTDFVVSASETSVRALVNEGAIVMAPFSNDCTAEAFGPCAENAVELTGTSLQLLEFDGNSSTPRLLPAPHERDPGVIRDEVMVALNNVRESDEAGQNQSTSNEVYLEGVTSTQVTAAAASISSDGVSTGGQSAVADLTPTVAMTEQELTDRQLVWGRWADGAGALERITLPVASIREGRQIGVGNSQYVLLRPDLPDRPVDAGLGVVGFNLNSAQAFYQSESGIVAMQVGNGSLNIDFDQNQFATSLDLQHSLTGLVNFQAQGSVFDGGFFNVRDESQRVAGTVSLDGQEAGYFFEKQLEEGGISGLTLWSAQ